MRALDFESGTYQGYCISAGKWLYRHKPMGNHWRRGLENSGRLFEIWWRHHSIWKHQWRNFKSISWRQPIRVVDRWNWHWKFHVQFPTVTKRNHWVTVSCKQSQVSTFRHEKITATKSGTIIAISYHHYCRMEPQWTLNLTNTCSRTFCPLRVQNAADVSVMWQILGHRAQWVILRLTITNRISVN